MINLCYDTLVTSQEFVRVEDGWDCNEVLIWECEHGGVFLTLEELAKALVRLAPLVEKKRVKNIWTYWNY